MHQQERAHWRVSFELAKNITETLRPLNSMKLFNYRLQITDYRFRQTKIFNSAPTSPKVCAFKSRIFKKMCNIKTFSCSTIAFLRAGIQQLGAFC